MRIINITTPRSSATPPILAIHTASPTVKQNFDPCSAVSINAHTTTQQSYGVESKAIHIETEKQEIWHKYIQKQISS